MELVTGVKGEAHITPLQDAMFHRGIMGGETGVFNIFDMFKIEKTSNISANIFDGVGLLQGRVFLIEVGNIEAVNFTEGALGFFRKDLITARWTADTQEGTQSMALNVLTGTPTESDTAIAPTPTTGDIDGGATVVDFPLYIANFSGETLVDFTPQFSANLYGIATVNEYTMIQVPAAGWSLSSTYTGFYENTILRTCVLKNPAWGITGNDALPTEDEETAFAAINYLVPTDNTMIFLSREQIVSDVYLNVQGVLPLDG